ncbi:MAG: hypothetical protein HS115_07580 [Spirochaetales bacterium]|nr:hypothetical protein [Spirochaetales bacterium]
MVKRPLVVGLGRMGLGVAQLLKDHNYEVVAWDTQEVCRERARSAGIAVVGPDQVTGSDCTLLFVPHQAVDGLISVCRTEILLDCGNSHYKDSIRRHTVCQERGIIFFDVGTSGGVLGARQGPCLTVGGRASEYERIRNFLHSFARSVYFGGAPGAGHLIKTVHNGIEYGYLQALGEGLELLQRAAQHENFSLDLPEICRVWNEGSIIESRLLQDAAQALQLSMPEATKIGGGETGGWACELAEKIGIPVPVLQAALLARQESQKSPGIASGIIARIRYVFGRHAP